MLTTTNRARIDRLLYLLTATALATGVVGFSQAQAQVIIGGEVEKPPIEIYNVKPAPFSNDDGWPYNVKGARKSFKDLDKPLPDPSKLPSRQVSPQLMQAARLEQSGLTKDDARQAAASLAAGGLQAPQLGGEKPDAARDPDSTLPAVTTGQLMGQTQPSQMPVADAGSSSSVDALAAPEPATAMDDSRESLRVLDKPKNLADSITVPEMTAPAAMAESAPAAAPAPESSKARPLFSGRKKRAQVASNDAAPAAAPESNASQVLQAPEEAPAPQAMPAEPVDKLADMPVPVPDTAPVDAGEVAALTDLKAPPPKLLGGISEDSKGTPHRMKLADATPVAKAPDAADEPAPEPAPDNNDRHHDAVAVLPSKAEEKAVATVPQRSDESSDGDAPPPAEAAEDQKPAAQKSRGFWDWLFGSSDASAPKKTSTVEIKQAAPVTNEAELPAPMEPDSLPAANATKAAAPEMKSIDQAKAEPGFWERLFGRDDNQPGTPVGINTETYKANTAGPAVPEANLTEVEASGSVTVPAVSKAMVAPDFRVEAALPEAPIVPASMPRLVPVAPTVSSMAAVSEAHHHDNRVPAAQINFLPASQMVDGVGQGQLRTVADEMQANPESLLVLNAYAQASNSIEARRVSLNRALAVRRKLAELGIQPARVEINTSAGYGAKPANGNGDRVDVILYH